MDSANRVKDFVLSIMTRIKQMLRRTHQTQPTAAAEESSNPPSLPPASALDPETELLEQREPEPAAVPAIVAQNAQQKLDWPLLVVAFCFTSAVDIAFQTVQNHIQLPTSFHVLSFAIALAFTSLFVAKYISSKYPSRARVLEHVGILFAVTAFFVAITISFPVYLKLMAWTLYVLSLLVIFICNRTKRP